MELKLLGHLSYIDKYNRLKFTYLDESARQKLEQHCKSPAVGQLLPYNNEEFTVAGIKNNEDIKQFIGLDCIIKIKLVPYSFISKFDKNKGDHIVGTRLILTDIHQI